MQTRRRVLGTIGFAGVGALAGCSLLGDTIEKESGQAAVTGDALETTGYEFDSEDTFVIEETVEVQDESRDVKLTNWLTAYTRSIPEVEIDGAQFSIITSPTVSVAGKDANPLRRMDEKRLLEEVIDRAGMQGLKDIEEVGERTVSVLDTDTTITEYEAVTEEGDIEVRLHFGNLTNDGDFLMLLGMHPELVDETENVDTMAGGIDHPAEP